MIGNLWPKTVGVTGPKIIGHQEILMRARSDILRELDALEARRAEEKLPNACYVDEKRALGSKVSALNTMLYYECGQYGDMSASAQGEAEPW